MSKQKSGNIQHSHDLNNVYALIGFGNLDGSFRIFQKHNYITYKSSRNIRIATSADTTEVDFNVATPLTGITDSTKNLPPYFSINMWIRIN